MVKGRTDLFVTYEDIILRRLESTKKKKEEKFKNKRKTYSPRLIN